jgi:hypothetical protein
MRCNNQSSATCGVENHLGRRRKKKAGDDDHDDDESKTKHAFMRACMPWAPRPELDKTSKWKKKKKEIKNFLFFFLEKEIKIKTHASRTLRQIKLQLLLAQTAKPELLKLAPLEIGETPEPTIALIIQQRRCGRDGADRRRRTGERAGQRHARIGETITRHIHPLFVRV